MRKRLCFKVLSCMMLIMLVSCGGKSYDSEEWANEAIKYADASVEQTEHEMLGKLPYYTRCNEVAKDTLNKIVEEVAKGLAEDIEKEKEEKRIEAANLFVAAVDSAISLINKHYEVLSDSEQKALIGKSLKAACDADAFESSVTKAEIESFKGTSQVKIKVTLTAKKPLGRFFRMVLANDKMQMIAPFSLMCTPKSAGETFETTVGVPMNMLAQTSILLFDKR